MTLRAELQRRVDSLQRRSEPEAAARAASKLVQDTAALAALIDPTPRPPFESHRAKGRGKVIVGLSKKLFARALRPLNRATLQRQLQFNVRAQELLQAVALETQNLADRLREATAQVQVRQDELAHARQEREQMTAQVGGLQQTVRELSIRLATLEKAN